jgi:hypothetical protein
MAIIPIPERGQPLDVTYISQIVQAVNTLSTSISTSSSKTLTVDTLANGQQGARVSDSKIVGGYKEVVNKTSVTAGQEEPFTYTYSEYKYPPIITATPVNISGTSAGSNVSIILKTPITTNRVDGIVRFNVAGEASVGVNLIIIGVPN